jgi:indoleamine 2,3-dioxygenase
MPDIEHPVGNLELIRKFNGCVDEHGFVLVHVAIVSHTHKQAEAHAKMFEGAAKKDRALMNEGISQHLDTLNIMNDIFKRMWNVSTPQKYLNFRTFIMGIQGNDDIFPNGVLYKGCSDTPWAFRGETGAQDSIIPATDNAFGLEYPRNSLTEYLFDLRSYRPYYHQKHVQDLRKQQLATK